MKNKKELTKEEKNKIREVFKKILARRENISHRRQMHPENYGEIDQTKVKKQKKTQTKQ